MRVARGARIHAEIVGFGCNSDGVHITQPTAATMARAMQLALDDARLAPGAIGYVNAHGTATDRGDVAESHATAQTFGERMPISSLKSYVGHTLGACGALEAWWTIEMMKRNWYAPTLNLDPARPCLRIARLHHARGARDRRRVRDEQQLRVRRHQHVADLQARAVSASARRGLSRVVVTGMGIVSCLGNTLDGVSSSLRVGRSGITRVEAWRERGFASQVAGVASVDQETPFDRRVERFMGDTARFACHAARKAVDDAGLDLRALRSPRAGAVIGSGVGALSAYDAALATAHARGVDKVPPYAVPQTMSSTASASVAQFFGIEGTCYSPSSACTTSALAIGQAMQLIQTGRQDIVLAGGSEALHDNTTLMFDAMGALSRRFNETPQSCLASLRHAAGRFRDRVGRGSARARGTRPRARARRAHLCRTDRLRPLHRRGGHDRAACAGNRAGNAGRARRSRRRASRLRQRARAVHVPGDSEEARAMTEVFGERMPPFSSTKGFTGHPLGACGVHEAIYALLMMRDGFMAGWARSRRLILASAACRL